jgi:hypothetical protein
MYFNKNINIFIIILHQGNKSRMNDNEQFVIILYNQVTEKQFNKRLYETLS